MTLYLSSSGKANSLNGDVSSVEFHAPPSDLRMLTASHTIR